MNDIVLLYGMTLTAVCVLVFLYTILKLFLKNKLLQAENKLRLRMQSFDAKYREMDESPQGYVGSAIGDMGIEGILQELGVPKPFQGIAKGFIDSIMSDPKKMAALAEKFGVKLPNGVNSKSQETDLL